MATMPALEPGMRTYDGIVRTALGDRVDSQSKPIIRDLTGLDLLRLYALAKVSRDMDVRERTLQAQGKAWFSIAGAGREVLGWAFARHLKSSDPKFPYYRDRTLVLAAGLTPTEMFRETVGASTDPASGGRQMPSHWGAKAQGVVSQTSPTGSQALPAVGLAEGILRAKTLGLTPQDPWAEDSVVYVSLGEGTTAQGEIEEAVRQACRAKAPVIFVVEDDKYAISIPATWSIPGGDVFELYRHYENMGMLVLRCDGTDVEDTDSHVARVVAHTRTRLGPALLHARVTRPMSHSSTDTQEQYRSAQDLADEKARDTIPRLRDLLKSLRVATDQDLSAIDAAALDHVRSASDEALLEPPLDPATILLNVRNDNPPHVEESTPAEGEPIEMRYAINRALKAAMAADPRIIMFGEDVADAPTTDLPGKGGVFHVTRGLQFAFPNRVWNSPLAEATIVGTSVGQSLAGLLPVVEVQFRDYLNPAIQQLTDEAGTMRWRSNGEFTCPMVIRMAYGGYLGGAGALWHSEAGVGMVAGHPGIRIVVPSNAVDAAGLLRSAIESGDVVLFMEPKVLYARKAPYPGDDFRVPLGKARIAKSGGDSTVVCWGNLVPRSLEAAQALGSEGIGVEVIDLRTVDSTWDVETVMQSVSRTGSLLVAEEDRYTGGFGATVAARVAEELPGVIVSRLAAKDCRVAYGPRGEQAVLPQVADIVQYVRRAVEE